MVKTKGSRTEGGEELAQFIDFGFERGYWSILLKGFSAVILAGLTGFFASGCNKAAKTPEGKGGSGQKGFQGPVAVVIGKVEQKDVPIYRDGLGTVQAFNTVTVRSR